MTTEANITTRSARWTRQSASATSTCGSNPSRVLACNSWRTLCAWTVACQRSIRPKPLTAPCRHPQLSSRPPLCRHLSLSFAMKLAKAVGLPLPKAFIETVFEQARFRFCSLSSRSCCSWTHKGLLLFAVDEERREVRTKKVCDTTRGKAGVRNSSGYGQFRSSSGHVVEDVQFSTLDSGCIVEICRAIETPASCCSGVDMMALCNPN